MSKFDTHGGYFAPKDYMRVNEGGSHEENPNGGVQIGVDPEGNPNLLEEGEPVYKDYVYSDNIEAEEQFLVDNNLPKKYTGKLYSKIADDLFIEAEERPLDPISRNGLEALLGRLADAQEGQKQAKEQKDLEDELASLSPEELEQLESMLTQSEQVQMVPEQMPMEAAPEEQMMGPAEPMPIEGMPIMANGGFLRTFETGGPKKSMADEIAAEILAQANSESRASGIGNTDLPLVSEHPELDIALMAAQPGGVVAKALAPSAYRGMVSGLANGDAAYAVFNPIEKIFGIGKTKYLEELSENIYKGERWNKVRDIQKTLRQRDEELKKLAAELKGAKKANNHTLVTDIESKIRTQEFARKGDLSAFNQEYKTAEELEPIAGSSKSAKSGTAPKQELQPAQSGQSSSAPEAKTFNGKPLVKTAIGTGLGAAGVAAGYNYLYKPIAKDIWEHRHQQPYIFAVPDSTDVEAIAAPSDTIKIGSSVDLGFLDEEPEYKAFGGKINRFDDGGWGAFLDRLWSYKESLKPSAMSGKYAIDRRGDFWGGRPARQVESDPNYDAFTQYVLSHGDDPQVQRYLRALDVGVNTEKGVPLLWDKENNKLFDNWATLYGDRRRDGKLGIYHITPEDIGFLTAPAAPATTAQSPQSPDVQYELFPGQLAAMQYGMEMDNLSPRMRYAMSYNGSGSPATNETNGAERVADDTIYGGSIDPSVVKAKPEFNTNLLPTWPRYAGAIGSGLLGLYNAFQQPDRYIAPHINPQLPEGRINLQNQVYNPIDQNMIANAQIAQGNATNRALRNSGLGPSSAAAILAADNNLTGNLGTGFIQAWDANNQRRNAVIAANNQAEAQRAQFDYTVDAARKDAINRLAPYNAQNDLMVQRLNNQAEGDKYTAISNQISNGLQALSGIGQENFAMNQINTNPAFLGYRVGPNGAMFFNPNTGKWEKVKS